MNLPNAAFFYSTKAVSTKSNKSKAAVKRAQSQTCLNCAEREQSRRKVNKSNKSNIAI